MKSISKNRISLILMLAIAISFSVIRLSNPPRNIISYDYYGFYLYLPALFIYDDIGIKNPEVYDSLNNIYQNTPTFYQLSPGQENTNVIRFFSGMSYMFAPGFFTGHIIALLTHHPADGFSLPYQRALLVSGMIISLLGLFFARKILLRFFSDLTTSITLVLLFIGSNLAFFYTFGNDAPHLYLFSLYTIFIWLTIKWHEGPTAGKTALLGLVSGLIIASRPSELISLIIPLAWGIYNSETLKQRIALFIKHYDHLLTAMFWGLLLILPQLIYWKAVTGSFFFSPYDDPASTLNLGEPQLMDTLFGFRKGWFIYSPIMIFAVGGLIIMFRKKPGYALPLAIFILLNTYLIASFTSLISYGWRAFIQSYAMLILPMGFFVDFVITRKKQIRALLLILLTMLTLLNLFKSWQWVVGVMDGSRMTREYYFATFFKLKASAEDRELLLIERPVTDVEIFDSEEKYKHKVLIFYDFEIPDPRHEFYYDTTHVFEGRYSFRLDSTMQFSPGYTAQFSELTDNYYAWIRLSAWVWVPESELISKVRLVAHFKNRGNIYKYRSANLGNERFDAKAGQWSNFQLDYLTPEVVSRNDLMKIYVWYAGKEPIYIDNLKVELFER